MTRSMLRILTSITLTGALAACGATHEARPAATDTPHHFSMVADAAHEASDGRSPAGRGATAAGFVNPPLAEIVVEGRRLADSQLAEIVVEGRRLADSQLAEIVVEGRRLSPVTLATVEIRADRLSPTRSGVASSGDQVAALLD